MLTYAGANVRPYYFSTSNGHTEASSDQFGGAPLPYLMGISDLDPSGRAWDADSPFGTWRTESFGLTVLGDALRVAAAGVNLGDITSLEIRRTDGGRTVRIQVNGTAGSANVSPPRLQNRVQPARGAPGGRHRGLALPDRAGATRSRSPWFR